MGCSCGAVGEGFPRRYLARLSPHTRIGRVPISYPTTSTRRLMSPTADARTGRKAYADCRRDCRNTGINIQRGLRKVNACAIPKKHSIQYYLSCSLLLIFSSSYFSFNWLKGASSQYSYLAFSNSFTHSLTFACKSFLSGRYNS